MFVKYPKIFHHPFSKGVTINDKIINNIEQFIGKKIVITEKMDGENTTMTKYKMYARSPDSDNFTGGYVKDIYNFIVKPNIPEDLKLCGENMTYEHSIKYENLNSYFLVHTMFSETHCLSWNYVENFCEKHNLQTVPLIYIGLYDKDIINNIIKSLDLNKQEGIVIRLYDDFSNEDFDKYIVKWVRPNHVSTNKHWTKKLKFNDSK